MAEEKMVCGRFPAEEVEIIEGLVGMGFFKNRSDFLRYAVHRAITDYLMGIERAYRILGGEFLKLTYWVKEGKGIRKVDRSEFLRIVNEKASINGVRVVEELEMVEGVDSIVFDLNTGDFEVRMSKEE